jgi:hypothetical protein
MRGRTPPPPLNPPAKPSTVGALVREVGEAADIALGSAQIAQKAATKIVDALPTPDPRDNVDFQRLAERAQSMVRRLLPWTRNRWPELCAIDDRLGDLDRPQEELVATLADLHGRRALADADYADRLAQLMAAGQPDPKPVDEAPVLDAAIREAEGEHAAADRLRERIGTELADFVVRHRPRLVDDVDRETEETKRRYLDTVAELERLRGELRGLRQTARWTMLFPDELAVAPVGNEAMLALGLLKPVAATLGVTQQVAIASVFDALRADADTITERLTVEQRKELGLGAAPTPEREAMWHDDPAYQEWAKEQRERLNEMAKWAATPAQLRGMAQEMRDE